MEKAYQNREEKTKTNGQKKKKKKKNLSSRSCNPGNAFMAIEHD